PARGAGHWPVPPEPVPPPGLPPPPPGRTPPPEPVEPPPVPVPPPVVGGLVILANWARIFSWTLAASSRRRPLNGSHRWARAGVLASSGLAVRVSAFAEARAE